VTCCLQGSCSGQLSYAGIKLRKLIRVFFLLVRLYFPPSPGLHLVGGVGYSPTMPEGASPIRSNSYITTVWRPSSDSNRGILVLQTSALDRFATWPNLQRNFVRVFSLSASTNFAITAGAIRGTRTPTPLRHLIHSQSKYLLTLLLLIFFNISKIPSS
jgi:hypothetical protein